MKKQQIQLALALSLLLSIGFANLLLADPLSTNPVRSENCEQAAKTRESLANSVSKVLCAQEHANEEVFSTFIDNTNTFTGEVLSHPGQKTPRTDQAPRRLTSTEPKKPVKVKGAKLHKQGGGHFVASDNSYGERAKTEKTNGKHRHHQGSDKRLVKRDHTPRSLAIAVHNAHAGRALTEGRKGLAQRSGLWTIRSNKRIEFFPGRTSEQISHDELKKLRRNLESLLTRKEVIALLAALQRSEGGGRLTVVGGTRNKSLDCRQRIAKLNSSGHPKEQGLPNRCFLSTRKYGLSTAAGFYQIVYYRNWKSLRKQLGLKDFSDKSQAIAALELIRTSAVKGSKVGDGFAALVKGDLYNAVRKGTDPWASSPYSRWRGKHPAPLLQYARQEFKKLSNQQYARRELQRFRRDTNS